MNTSLWIIAQTTIDHHGAASEYRAVCLYDVLTIYSTLSAKSAAALDQELMSTGAFSIDQLMELAGLSVSQAGECTSPKVSRSILSILNQL